MDADSTGVSSVAGYEIVGRKSWLAYLGASINFVIKGGFVGAIVFDAEVQKILDEYNENFVTGGVVILVFIACGYLYRLLVLRSFEVITTEDGVYYSYGILPWAKYRDGIKWNDIDMSHYYPNLLSWLTNSYKITVSHKFTNRPDFFCTNIWMGNRTSQTINHKQQALGEGKH